MTHAKLRLIIKPMRKMEKIVSATQAYERMKRTCARKECCTFDIRGKLSRWDLSEEAMEAIISELKEKKFIDEERFIRSFINDKLQFNKWGRKKIEAALLQKQLPREAIERAFSEYSDRELSRSLPVLLKKRWTTVTGNSSFERKSKLIRYALGRGFTMEEINHYLGEINLKDVSGEGDYE